MKYEVNQERACYLGLVVGDGEPSLYQVVVHNDDFTPMEFVVEVLETFFYMERGKAIEVMLNAHVNGNATCGCYTKEVAETKIIKITEHATTREHPLVFSMELM
ncbi:MAG: hypothetical protein A3F14_05415 [Gammaproteobacteria bacterium RIFCSPHIGHO2_12_FULL_43_28]|nr:MAG: hypothetical protein A3F14_05415 [Gammaproteobacteria bacterium RIFCSPHIGHO2_12_FULL_43_28]